MLYALPDVDPAPAVSPPGSFHLTRVDGANGVTWLSLWGELDMASATELDAALRDAAADAHPIMLDLRELTFMDCAGLHVIVDAVDRSRKDGSRLVVIRGPEEVDRVFAITGSSGVFDQPAPAPGG